MFDQPELEQVLRDNLGRFGSVTLRGDVEVTAVRSVGSGDVHVDFTDRQTGRSETVVARYVLGCDGANSQVRTSIGSSMRDLGFDQRWLVVDVATSAELGQWEGVHQVCDPVRAATYMRIGETRYRWEFRLREGESVTDFGSLVELHPLIRPWTGDVDPAALEIVRVAEYTFRAQLADRWRSGNVFLLGDAAHLTPPFIGQGMGAGLRDAANLGWKLAGVLDGSLPESVLDSYQVERKPHARSMIRLAKLMGALMTEGGSTGNLLRRLVAPRLAVLPGLRARVVESETPALRSSALVIRRGRGRRLAGRLCPNPPMPGGGRLDDLSRGRFLVVTDGIVRAPNPADACVVPAPEGSDLQHWLRRHRAQVVVVRPDHTVMRSEA
jgi:3-(3-hydroxy-phenyl)propionate hydroxylase